MQFVVVFLGWIKSAFDWAQFGDAALLVLQKWFGVGVVSSITAAVIGAYAEATGFQVALMAVAVFATFHLVLILREIKKPKGLVIEFKNEPPFVYDVVDKGTLYRCNRFRITNKSKATIGSCKAQIARVVNAKGTMTVGIQFALRQSHHHDDDVFTLRRGEETWIDLIAVPLSGPRKMFPARIADKSATEWPDLGNSGACLPSEAATVIIQVVSDAEPVEMKMLYEELNGEWTLNPI